MKKFEKIIGEVSEDVDIERVMSFLKLDAEAMTGRRADGTTKTIAIEISIKELP